MTTVAILAGGMATRLHPITEAIPKSLVEVNGNPFICYQLNYLRIQGVRDVVLCLGHLGRDIETFVGDGRKYGLVVRYSYDGDYQLGTGGCIKKALSKLPDYFGVMYGDSLIDLTLKSVFDKYERFGRSSTWKIVAHAKVCMGTGS